MVLEKEQVLPLAPTSDRLSREDDDVVLHRKTLRQRKLIRCCGCITAALLVQAAVIIILAFTVFRVKDPVIKMNGIAITKLNLINATRPKPGSNISLTADVSVKNPNFASFRYANTSTTLYYYGTVVGEARGPPGQARARRTMRMNITVDIIVDRLVASRRLTADVNSGILALDSYSRIPGRVKMLKIVKKHVIVKMRCTMRANITSQSIQDQKCKRKVDLDL